MMIDEIINMLFIGVPYSKKYFKIRHKIKKSLEQEYKKYLENNDELTSLSLLLKNYGTLEKAATFAGYEKSEIKTWTQSEKIYTKKEMNKILKKDRLCINAICLLFLLSISLFIFINESILFLLPLAITIPLIILLTIRIRKSTKAGYNYSFESYDEAIKMFDTYIKKVINSSIVTIYTIFATISIVFLINYNLYELISQLFYNVIIFEIVLFCLIKNVAYYNYLNKIFENKNKEKVKKHFKFIGLFSIIYWILSCILTFIFRSKFGYIIFIIASILYFIISLLYILKKRKEVTNKNIVINKTRIGLVALFLCTITLYLFMKVDFWFLQPYINEMPTVEVNKHDITYNNDTGVYTIKTNSEDFKILQLTDIHLGGSSFSISKDKKALYSIYELINYTKPDLVIVTGDLVFPVGIMSMSFNNNTPIMQFAAFMRNIGVPWVFAYGNHDTETYAKLTYGEVEHLLKSLSFKNSKNLLYPYTEPPITGRNNQIIELRNQNNELIQALFIMDSNSYTGEGLNEYDYIHDDQVMWYEEKIKELNEQEGKTISSMIFFHIPIEEYKEAYNLYKNGSDEVIYHFGKIGEPKEALCTSNYSSKLFETALDLKSTKAMFCGHDHYNNISLTYKGIRLTYGLSIDYLAYPGIENQKEQRGGTLITIHNDESFDVSQIKLSDILPDGSTLK